MTAEFFAGNRARLVAAQPSSVIVLAGNREMQAAGDMAYPFRQEANFWWLTGIEKPDWWLIIDGKAGKSYLVSPKSDATRAVFDGELDETATKAISGVNGVLSSDDGHALLRDLARTHSVAYGLGRDPHDAYYYFVKNPAQKDTWQLLERTFAGTSDIRKTIAKLRAIKTDPEIAAIQKAIKITNDAFTHVKHNLATYKYEYEIEAEFSFYFRKNGASGHAYDPIVASGANACTLHYSTNDSRLKKKDLLLMDIGARYAGYPADITRTYALGEPTKRQKAVHTAVQSAHEKIIALLAPGLSLESYSASVDEIMQDALISLGLLGNRSDTETYRRYFPHAISHGLGVDVHDSLGGFGTFRAGMVLTVEPGMYIPEESIGVRIEDNILITETGFKNLSASLSTDG